jgi:hypothetical protein
MPVTSLRPVEPHRAFVAREPAADAALSARPALAMSSETTIATV